MAQFTKRFKQASKNVPRKAPKIGLKWTPHRQKCHPEDMAKKHKKIIEKTNFYLSLKNIDWIEKIYDNDYKINYNNINCNYGYNRITVWLQCPTLHEWPVRRMERPLLLHLTLLLGIPRYIYCPLGFDSRSCLGNLPDWYLHPRKLCQDAPHSIQEFSLCHFLRGCGYLRTNRRDHHEWKTNQARREPLC